MVTVRTVAQIEAELTAVRDAYLRALRQTQGSQTTGAGSVSFTRADPESLRRQMLALEAELKQRDNGGARVVGVVPSD